MGKFEDRLLTDLLTEYRPTLDTVEPPAPRRGGHRPLWIGAGALGLAGAVTAGVVLLDGGTPAYAVTKSAGGDVTVTIRETTGIDGANAELRELGVPAVVVPVRPGCVDLDDLAHTPAADGVTKGEFLMATGEITFRAFGVPEGQTVVLFVERPTEADRVAMGIAMVDGDPPDCVTLQPEPAPGDEPQPTDQPQPTG